MTTDHDDLDDPEMAKQLRRWGRQVCRPSGAPAEGADTEPAGGGPKLFEPPRDLSPMHRALDVVDRDLVREEASVSLRMARARWFRAGAAVAASVAIIVSVWWFVWQPRRAAVGPAGTVALVLSNVHVSAYETVLRGEPEGEFRSGDDVYVHFAIDRPGTAFVAMLDSRVQFEPLSKNAHSMGEGQGWVSFELDDRPGTESFVVLASATPLNRSEFVRVVVKAASATIGMDNREAALREIMTVLRSDPRIEAEAITFKHIP